MGCRLSFKGEGFMCFRRVFRLLIILLFFAVFGYGLYESIGWRVRYCAVVSNPVSAVGFMMLVGWFVFLGFGGEKKKP